MPEPLSLYFTEDIMKRRIACAKALDYALRGHDREQLVFIITSYMDIQAVEAMTSFLRQH